MIVSTPAVVSRRAFRRKKNEKSAQPAAVMGNQTVTEQAMRIGRLGKISAKSHAQHRFVTRERELQPWQVLQHP
jgi:hypothetical protein